LRKQETPSKAAAAKDMVVKKRIKRLVSKLRNLTPLFRARRRGQGCPLVYKREAFPSYCVPKVAPSHHANRRFIKLAIAEPKFELPCDKASYAIGKERMCQEYDLRLIK